MKKPSVIFKDRGMKKVVAQAAELAKGRMVKVGILNGGEEYDGKGHATIGLIGAVHEYGNEAGTIPARPFLGDTARREKSKIQRLQRDLAVAIVEGRTTVERALRLLGETHAADVKMTFINNEWAALKQATIDRKGSSRPLIDTGQLRRSIAYEVEK